MPSQLFFRPSAIELKLYRKFRADQAHNPTKLDHYPINIKGVMTIRVRVGPTPNCHNSLNMYRIVIELGGYPINIKGVMTIRVRVGPTGSSVVDACRPNCFLDLQQSS